MLRPKSEREALCSPDLSLRCLSLRVSTTSRVRRLKAVEYAELVRRITSALVAKAETADRLLVVGLDGPDCAGKTTLAASLGGTLQIASVARDVIHYDDFVHPEFLWLGRGAERFYRQCFDPAGLRAEVLARAGAPLASPPPAVLLVEGLFLLSSDLRDLFDVVVRLELSEDLVLARALERDGPIKGEDWVRVHYNTQCIPAQRWYRRQCRPADMADLLVHVQDGGDYAISFAGTQDG
jgi:uridine kinase